MNLYQCQKAAERKGEMNGKFVALFPAGPRICTWLDPYFGLFCIEGMMDGKFVTVGKINEMFPELVCEAIDNSKAENAA